VLEGDAAPLRPEFLNRVRRDSSSPIALPRPSSSRIVEIQLNRLRARAWPSGGLSIELTAEARSFLVRTGYDPNYGARPLKRAIQKEIETPLARRLLKGELRDGQTVDVDSPMRPGRTPVHTRAINRIRWPAKSCAGGLSARAMRFRVT